MGERALAMSRELEDREQEAKALNTLGAAKAQAGDTGGIELIERVDRDRSGSSND